MHVISQNAFDKVIKEEKVLLVLRAKKWKVISDKMGGKIFQFMGSQKQHPIHRKKKKEHMTQLFRLTKEKQVYLIVLIL